MSFLGDISNLNVKKGDISFYVNGQLQTIKGDYSVNTNLNDYLRDVLHLTGTKTLCNEGGCGLCAVNASVYDPATKQKKDFSINSCLFPLYKCDGYSFTTVEGIGSKKSGLHPIQKRLSENNASQCGYCTPGFVMSMFSLLKNNPKPSKDEIEKSFDGNICRCTGYRAILESMKTFAKDEMPIDIEDLENIKCLHGKKDIHCHSSASHNHSSCNLLITKNSKEWFSPSDLNDVYSILPTLSSNTVKFRFVCGNTSVGIYKNENDFDLYINLNNIRQLNQFDKSDDKLIIGSNVSLQELIKLFEKVSKEEESKYGHLSELAQAMKKVGNIHVRNVASWSGNLALKKRHPDFPSDVFIILETAGAKLKVMSVNKTDPKSMTSHDLTPAEYLKSSEFNDRNHFIESVTLPSFDQSTTRMKVFKVSPRTQNSHAYVNCGLRFIVDPKNPKKLTQKPSIVFNGIDASFSHAVKTEEFLQNQNITDEETFKKSIQILNSELEEAILNQKHNPLLPSGKYRVSVGISLYYKFILTIYGQDTRDEFKSATDTIVDLREISRAEHKLESKSELYPLTKPMAKISAQAQTTGEAKYVGDLSPNPHQLNGAFILSTVANAKIDSIDTSDAMKVEGVRKILFSEHIPGENNIMNKPHMVEILFSDKFVEYTGQPIGLVVADTLEHAKEAAKLVRVNYVDIKPPILTFEEAIKQNSYHPKPPNADKLKGDPLTAIQNSKHKISGEILFDNLQFNFYLEGLVAVCEPTEDGFKIECNTQWIDYLHRSVANVLGLENSSCIDIQVKQVGGAFGGKLNRPNIVACAAAIAANQLNVPVKVSMDLNDCLDMLGRRPSYFAKYTVGFDDDGKINGIEYDWFSDPGISPNSCNFFFSHHYFESAYNCPNMKLNMHQVKTNKAACVEVRCTDVLQTVSFTEHVLDHVASYLNKDALDVRRVNLFRLNDETIMKHKLAYLDIENVTNQLVQSSEYAKRKAQIEQFNKLNRYKKKGIALIPLRYPMVDFWAYYNAIVSIKHSDGSVAISHGGVECGQGMHTKVAQVCAQQLGIPLELINVKNTNSLINPNAGFTGGSVTIELVAKSIIGCCEILNKRLEPVRSTMPEKYTWKELIAKAFTMHVNLSSMSLTTPTENNGDLTIYDIDAAACTEVLIDVLTGETQITRTDILYDCGQSMNQMIDLGQAEGAFVMGLGYVLLEKTILDPETGKCLNNGTWEYKPPTTTDIPVDFRVKFVQNKPNQVGVLGSKAIGEPPLILCTSIMFALRDAISAARRDQGATDYFRLDLPAMIDNIQEACLVNPLDFKLN